MKWFRNAPGFPVCGFIDLLEAMVVVTKLLYIYLCQVLDEVACFTVLVVGDDLCAYSYYSFALTSVHTR